MKLRWTSKALSDLARLHQFLAAMNATAACRAIEARTRAPGRLLRHPRIGKQLFVFAPREVRRIVVSRYERLSGFFQASLVRLIASGDVRNLDAIKLRRSRPLHYEQAGERLELVPV